MLLNRSHTSRSHRAKSAWLAWTALALLGVAGCQNNSERDIIARDRRMQEDQLYAMQDYVSQYQQLVCRYRSENASLRRQIINERAGTSSEPLPRTPTDQPGMYNGPKIESSPNRSLPTKPMPNPDLQNPDVPPFKKTSWDGGVNYKAVADSVAGPGEPDRYAQVASYDEAATGARAEVETQANGLRQTNPPERLPAQSPDILLSGEVVANENGGGPRLVIDVEQFDQAGRSARFDGTVSAILMAIDKDGGRRNLGRWDFGPADVRSATDATASEPTMRFHIELPEGTRVNGMTELWVRLSPENGAKVLSSAKVDLSRPGVFSSRTDKLWASEEAVVAASYEETPSPSVETSTTMNEGKWVVAAPGKPANLPPDADRAGGGWRASSEPMPVAVAAGKANAPTHIDRPPATEASSKSGSTAELAKKPSWTPERPGKSSHDARPTWSATR